MYQTIQLEIDSDLLTSVKKMTGVDNNTQVINFALRELFRQAQQKRILELEGKIEWEGDLVLMRQGRYDSDCG